MALMNQYTVLCFAWRACSPNCACAHTTNTPMIETYTRDGVERWTDTGRDGRGGRGRTGATEGGVKETHSRGVRWRRAKGWARWTRK